MATHFSRLRAIRCLPVAESGSLSVQRLPPHYYPLKIQAFNPFYACIGMNPGINIFDKEQL